MTFKRSAWALLFALAGTKAIPLALDEHELDHPERNLRTVQSASSQIDSQQLPTPDSHRVLSLPLLDQVPESMELFSGHLSATPDGHKKLFYWLVAPTDEAVRQSPDTPLVIWLNGGPGCSSMEGFLIEHGPLQFAQKQDTWTIVPNPNSWHLAPAWVVYIDQPVGTGLSFTTMGDFATNDDQVNQDFVYFLDEFLLLHRQFFLEDSNGGHASQTRRPLFFTGESHAGHYIPSMMDYIIRRRNDPFIRVQIRLAGAAIGNGWIDPYHQYAAAEVAYGLGLISLSQKVHLDEQEKECQKQLDAGELTPKVCFSLLDDIVDESHGSGSKTRVSRYDARKWEQRGKERVFPRGHKIVESYLGGAAPPAEGLWNADQNAVLKALHATQSIQANQTYRGCADAPYYALAPQDSIGVVQQIVNVLEHNIRVLFYNGMKDLICNHVGNEVALMNLPWSQAEHWRLATRHAWRLEDGKPPVAYFQEHKNLQFLKVPESGHMLPKDQPELSLQMIRRFLYQLSFQSSPQELERANMAKTSC